MTSSFRKRKRSCKSPAGLGFALLLFLFSEAASAQELEIKAPSLWIKGVPAEISVMARPGSPQDSGFRISGDGLLLLSSSREQGRARFRVKWSESGPREVEVQSGPYRSRAKVRIIPGIWTLLPPLVAIGLALLFRQVLAALWVSVWLGAFIIYDWRPLAAVARSIDSYIIPAMADPDDAAMLVFIIFMGGMIGMLSRSGGIQGVVDFLARRATSPRKGQLAAFFMGLFVFFDDYANTIIVGNAMKPITDRLRISREKLSYIVDSTAAPVASLVPVSTWIGYEVGLINRALEDLGSGENGYMLFLGSIVYRFYPLFALILVFLVALTGRDFGPMARAEKRARTKNKPLRDGAVPFAATDSKALLPPDQAPRRWFNAVIPLLTVLFVTFIGLWIDGRRALGEEGFAALTKSAGEYGGWARIFILGQVYSAAAPNIVLAWASLAGCLVTVVMVTGQRILSLAEAMQAWLKGVESMVIAVVVLLFAWSLGSVCKDLHTAEYITHSLSGILSPRLLPALVFLAAAGISFATGTSYGTMAILMPLVIPVAHRLGMESGFSAGEMHLLFLGAVSSVLAGSVFGDHCSPISDTTIMSSMASSADHIDHVRTQLPYALLAAALGVAAGDLPSAYGLPPLVSIGIGAGAMLGFLYLFGEKTEPPAAKSPHKERGK